MKPTSYVRLLLTSCFFGLHKIDPSHQLMQISTWRSGPSNIHKIFESLGLHVLICLISLNLSPSYLHEIFKPRNIFYGAFLSFLLCRYLAYIWKKEQWRMLTCFSMELFFSLSTSLAMFGVLLDFCAVQHDLRIIDLGSVSFGAKSKWKH